MNARLLVPEYEPDPGGIAASASRIAGGLADCGLHVTVVTKHSRRDAPLGLDVDVERRGERLSVLRFPRGSFYPEHWGRELPELCERLRDRPPDVVHAMGSLRFGQIALAVGRRFGAPVVYGMRGSDVGIAALQNPGRFESVARGASALIAVSEALAERARAQSAFAANVRVIPNSVPPAPRPDRDHLRRRIGLSPDDLWIGACFSGLWKKGPERLRALLACVSRAHAGVLGLCVFGADDGGALIGAWQAERPPSERPFRHLGGLEPRSVLDVLGAVDLLVVSSQHEGMPNLLLQALSVGTPVAATPAGGCREVLEGSGAGILLSWDVEAAARALVEILASGALAPMRERARTRAVERHPPEREISALRELYGSLASASSERSGNGRG